MCIRDRYTGLFKISDDMSYSAGAFTEPLACALNGIKKLDIEIGDFVAVFGPGAMGMMMIQMCKALGASKVALMGATNDDWRLEQGKNCLLYTSDAADDLTRVNI